MVFIILLNLSFLSDAPAQTFQIRITPEAGFDVIDTIYNEFQQGQPQSVLTILNEYQPANINYVIQIRPTGQRLQLMIDNPDWSAAQLARMMVVTFPYPVDVTAVKENFENHPVLEVVNYEFPVDPVNFSPENPTSSDNVTMSLAFIAGNCETPSSTENARSHYVDVSDNTINLYVVVQFHFPSQPVGCSVPANMINYELGQLPPENYVINIYNVYDWSTFPVADDEKYFQGSTQLTIRGVAPQQVPSGGIVLMLLLSLMLTAFGTLRLTK